MKIIFYILTLSLLGSCNLYDRKDEVLLTDQDYVEYDRTYSPDSSMLIINYGIDLGAFGYGKAGTAILNLADTTKNIREYTIPNTMIQVRWLDNKTVIAKYDILPSIRLGEQIELINFKINGVNVKISAFDYIDEDHQLEIEHRETSPNGQYELIAYRYLKDRSNLNFIHVSIIPVGGQIPKYGNFLIADMQSDYVLSGTWTDKNELEFYSNSLYTDLIQYYLVKNRPNISFKIITDDKEFGSKYRWVK